VSTLDEKLEQAPAAQGALARRSLKSLKEARGYRVEAGDPKLPAVCSIGRMAGRAYWRYSSGRGEEATYEFTEEKH
jgi:uncharacterized membrane protein YebE (DUF533 family)